MEQRVFRFPYGLPENLPDRFTKFDPADFVGKADAFVKRYLKRREKIAVSASGGVDSTTVAYLLQRIAGDNIYPFFIDDGLRRVIRGREEWEVTRDVFKDMTNFRVVHVKEKFLPSLCDLSDGEAKRNVFRENYTKVSNEILQELSADWIADGTIAPDIIETEGEVKVKTQHNVGLPYATKKFELIASLYKPHVRRLGKYLGIPDKVAFGIPCPGPAEMLRVGGIFTDEKLQIAKIATDVVEQMTDEYCRSMWSREFQYDEATGVRTPFQMFGVVVDSWMKELSALSDFLYEARVKCYKMKTRTTYIEEGIKRSEPITMPILWLESEGEHGHENLLNLGKDIWNRFGYPRLLYQVYDSGRTEGYPVFIRVVESQDAIVANPMKIDFDYLEKMGKTIAQKNPLVTKVAYDYSTKPPATIEII